MHPESIFAQAINVVCVLFQKTGASQNVGCCSSNEHRCSISFRLCTYHRNATSFAAMFGVQPLTIRRHIQMNKLNIKFPVGHSMSTAQKDAWDELLHGKTSDEDAEVEVEDVPATKLDEAASKQSMDMKRFSLCFNGRIDVNMIANSLLHILGDNAVGEVEIVCNLG